MKKKSKAKKSKTIGRKKQRDSRHLMWGNPHTANAIEPTGWGYHNMLQQYEHKMLERDRMDKVKAVQEEDKKKKFVYDHIIHQGVAKANHRNERVKKETEFKAYKEKVEHDMKEINHAHNDQINELKHALNEINNREKSIRVDPKAFDEFHSVKMKVDEDFPDEGFTLPTVVADPDFVMVPDTPTPMSRMEQHLTPENANDLLAFPDSFIGKRRAEDEGGDGRHRRHRAYGVPPGMDERPKRREEAWVEDVN